MKTKSVFRLIIISFLLMVFTGSLVQAEDPNTNDFIDSVVPGQLETEGLVFEEIVTDTGIIADANTSAFTWDYPNVETGTEALTGTLRCSSAKMQGRKSSIGTS